MDKLLAMEDFFEEDALRIKEKERAERLAKRAAAAAETRDNLFSMLEDDDEVPFSPNEAASIGSVNTTTTIPSTLDDEIAAKKLADHQRAVSGVLSEQYADPMIFMPLDTQVYLRELMQDDEVQASSENMSHADCTAAHHNH